MLADVGPLAMCKLLNCIDLGGCDMLKDVSPLEQCTLLTSLSLQHCERCSTDQLAMLRRSLPNIKIHTLGFDSVGPSVYSRPT